VTRYRIDPERSRVWVETKTSVHPIHGEATGLGGFIEAQIKDGHLDLTEPPKARVEFPIDRLSSGNALYDGELHRRAETRRYPEVVGEVREVTGDLGGRYQVRGDLTFHGVTQQVEGDVTVEVKENGSLEVQGEQTFNFENFGIKAPRILMLRVYPDVDVRIHLVARAE
jgi:polyisoprenoid-binding protein YceI